MNNNTILIVDDSVQDIHILLESLGPSFQVTAATSASKAMSVLEDHGVPEVILLDINMPEVNGYEFCRQLKSHSEYKKISVIFISANDSTDEIIEGLDAGAIDYITKPFDENIVKSKIRRVLTLDKEIKALIDNANSASQLAYTAMSESAYMGIVFRYLKSCFAIEQINELIKESLNCLVELELIGTIFFKYKNLEEVESTYGQVSLLELDLMSRMYQNKNPIYEKDQRLFVIRGSVVLCIKNLPYDENKRGSLRDYLMLFAEAHDAKLKQIYDNNQRFIRNIHLKSVIHELRNALNELRSNQDTHKRLGVSIIDEMTKSIEEQYLTIGLSEDQENVISEIIRASMHRFLDLIDIGTTLDSEMERIVFALKDLSNDGQSGS